MRYSQAESIRKFIEHAIKALNEYFEAEKESQASSAEYEKEYARRAALPAGTAPATKLTRPTKKKYEQEVRGGARSAPNRPRIANHYPWRRCVSEAARHLADCGWTTEASAIDTELDGLPKDNCRIDWSQPGTLQERRDKVSEAAHRIRDILKACRTEMAKSKESSIDSEPNGGRKKPSIEDLYDSLSEEKRDELWIFLDFNKFKCVKRNKSRAFLESRMDLSKYDTDSLRKLVDRVRKLEIVKGDKELRKLSSFRSKILKNSLADK